MDEVMAGFGRTGKMWGFQHYDGVVPDIVTSAKGLTGSYLPLAMVALREPIRQHFVDAPLGWGSTFQVRWDASRTWRRAYTHSAIARSPPAPPSYRRTRSRWRAPTSA